ncbi:META domain-containing protein [Edaphobacter albus]|uniref:META domain-containing protein n=1 Tax=Edaphobacter sp. 4G125 TaxID=2763071 RepID=UPI0016485C43|nr:META domain-containing protein [Edaphobacter sp. 4G125]QNI38014.1 META domain-containing protein [Edaphobacter sp. 4G125]
MKGIAKGCRIAIVVFLFLPGGAVFAQQSLELDGAATYRERIALPPDAIFEATLEDVSQVDAPASALGQARIEQPGSPPFHFTIHYDPTQILPNHVYAVRARIMVGGHLLFTTALRYQVLTQGHGSEIGMMMMRRVSRAAENPAEGAPSFRDTYWKLVRIGDRAITPADQQQEANLTFRSEGSRVTGSGGCNRLTGAYTLDGHSLRIQGVASTRMACMRGMETESKFLAVLEHVRGWKIVDRQLQLDDEDGKPLARFVTEDPKSK